jgi:hypothetical protein
MAEEVKKEEIKETLIEEQTPEEIVYTEREWKGLLGDKQNETRARQEAQAEAANLRIQIAELKAQKASTVEDDTGDSEDVATFAAVNKKLANLEKKLVGMYTKEKEDQITAAKTKLINESFEKAKEKYTEEKTGKGLSFDEVNEGTARMITKNKIYRDLILNDENPAEKAYEIGLQDPIIAKRLETYKKTLPEKHITPKEGLESRPSGAYYTPAMVQKMSDKEIDEHYPDIKESQKKWNQKKQE